MNLSQMHFYSYGQVAVNKALNTNDIEAWPAEISPMMDGEITDKVDTYEATGQDSLGNKFKIKADTSITIPATWFPFGQTNRITSPDVRRGEPVMIWQFADDSEQFWWTSLDSDISLRRLETVIFAISGSPKEDEKPSHTNTYYLELSSHKKAITLHTSTANGEPVTWDIQLNPGDNNFSIRNGLGDLISIDGKEAHIEIRNSVGSFFDMNKKKINIFAEEEVNIMSKRITLSGSNTIETKTKDMATTNSTWDIKSVTKHTGNLTETGMFVLNGNMSTTAGGGGSGKVEIGADVTVSQGVNVGGTLKANKVISSQNIDAPNV